jgi:hypothetical protein
MSRKAEDVVYAYGFFRGPSSKAYGRFWPTVRLADERSSEDISDFDVMGMKVDSYSLYTRGYAEGLNFKGLKMWRPAKAGKCSSIKMTYVKMIRRHAYS